MKLCNLYLACSVAIALFAIAAPAQEQVPQMINTVRVQPAKPSKGGASAANSSVPIHHTARPDVTRTCTYPFASGSGFTYINFCVTVNGNLSNFESPSGVELLDQDGAVEGYGLCDLSTSTSYYDYEYEDSGNWNAPTTVTSTATEVKIERTTTDGDWTLTQTISKVAGTPPYAKVVMALKNNSGIAKTAFLIRYAGFLGDDTASSGNFNENYDATFNSTWGYVPNNSGYASGAAYGMMLQNAGTPTPASAFFGVGGAAQNTEDGPDPCGLSAAGTVTNAQGAGLLLYVWDLPKEKTGTSTSKYFTF